MAIARRDLLGIGAAVAASMAVTSCSGTQEVPQLVDTSVPARPGAPSPGHLPLDLPAGSLYYGASVPYDRSVTAWERSLGTTLSLHRSYFVPDHDEAAQLVAQCRDDLANRRLPHVSVKPAGTWRELASGQRDAWLASMLAPLGEDDAPVLFTLHHEPENDTHPDGNTPADYLAMQRRVIRVAAELAPRVVVVPVLQHWTFDPTRPGTDPARWLVPEASVVGLDLYNPWSPDNGKQWRSFGSKLDEVLPWFGDRPLVIGEYGCRIRRESPGLAAEWLHDAATYARGHGVLSMSYFNSAVDAEDGSWELTGEMESAFAELLGSSWVARPPVPARAGR